jgi:DNA-binding PadR family transcriptional regulator
LIQVREKIYTSLYASSNEAKLSSEISDEDEEIQATEKIFSLTENGRTVATKLREALAARRAEDVNALDHIMLRYGSWPLNQLIRYVYRKFPEMTVKSVHPEAKRLLP